ncbi:MAG: iron-containing alcohol dehydrogenase [Elusimicrobiaceae bacterium]|nr:iron-containing alcohol dehydrogenase [Elusimicrobiaceae bacterium]
MINFTYHNPTKIIFGKGVLAGLGAECAGLGKKALLVYGRNSLKANGVFDTITAQLSSAGIDVVEFGGAQPNPLLSHAEAGVRLAREKKADFVLAAGGGSVMDTAKAIAAGAKTDTPLWDFILGKSRIAGALPLVTIVTMPATASEMNGIFVLTNDSDGNIKNGGGSAFTCPRVSFLDPSLTFGVSVKAAAFACSDIMSHLLEGYLTTTEDFCPVQDGYAEGVIKAVMEAMGRIMANPYDYDARASFMWAATLAWNGCGQAGLGGAVWPCHMLEYPLSGLYGLAHGAGLSVILPGFLRFSTHTRHARILKFGVNILGLEPEELTVEHVSEALVAFYRRIGSPSNFREAGIRDPQPELMADQVVRIMDMRGVKGYSREDILRIYGFCA